MSFETEHLGTTPTDIATAADLLRRGALVAFPTETVYGLGADATNEVAVAAIFAAKGRPRFNPLIAHVPRAEDAGYLVDLPEDLRVLAEALWPGPLTLVAPSKGRVAAPVQGGLATLAVRIPAHPTALALLNAAGRPIAAPSANPSGRLSPVTAAHVSAELSGKIAAIIDGGQASLGLESTIVGLAERNRSADRTSCRCEPGRDHRAGPTHQPLRTARRPSPQRDGAARGRDTSGFWRDSGR